MSEQTGGRETVPAQEEFHFDENLEFSPEDLAYLNELFGEGQDLEMFDPAAPVTPPRPLPQNFDARNVYASPDDPSRGEETCIWCQRTGQHATDCVGLDGIGNLPTPTSTARGLALPNMPLANPLRAPKPLPLPPQQAADSLYAPGYILSAAAPAHRNHGSPPTGPPTISYHQAIQMDGNIYTQPAPHASPAQGFEHPKFHDPWQPGYPTIASPAGVAVAQSPDPQPAQNRRPAYTTAPGFQAQNRLNPKHRKSVAPQQKQPPEIPQHQSVHGLPSINPDPNAPPPYASLHPTIAAAQQSLLPPREPTVAVGPPNDDHILIQSHLHQHAAALHSALSHPIGPPPSDWPDPHKTYFTSHQTTQLHSISSHLQTSPSESEARILLFLSAIITIHSTGIPQSIHERTRLREGYVFEPHGTCSERLAFIVSVLKEDKYVAMDVLSGIGVEDIARSPSRYMQRKRANQKVNAKKAHDKKVAELVQDGYDRQVAERMAAGNVEGVEDAATPATPVPYAEFQAASYQQVPAAGGDRKRAYIPDENEEERDATFKRARYRGYGFGFGAE